MLICGHRSEFNVWLQVCHKPQMTLNLCPSNWSYSLTTVAH